MNIGTAKPTVEEQQAAPHHFVNNLSIKNDYSVGDFERDALAVLEDLFSKKKYSHPCWWFGFIYQSIV